MKHLDTDYIRDFLAHMGVKAEVWLDERNEKLIVMSHEEFQRRKAWIETWFTLVEQNDDYCSFRERPRGTGQTI